MDYVRDFLSDCSTHKSYCDILQSVIHSDSGRTSSTLTTRNPASFTIAIQICLTAIALHPDHCKEPAVCFEESQVEMFAAPARTKLFVGKYKEYVNFRYLLHSTNYFRFHLKEPHLQGLLSHPYKQLDADQYPRTWLGKLKPGTQEIGKQWKGVAGKQLFCLYADLKLTKLSLHATRGA